MGLSFALELAKHRTAVRAQDFGARLDMVSRDSRYGLVRIGCSIRTCGSRLSVWRPYLPLARHHQACSAEGHREHCT